MKKLFGTKRAMVAVGLTAAVAVGLAGSAFAYFTASGSGSGSASVGSSSAITLDGTITGDLYPGGTAAGVSVLVTNPGSGSQHVGSVHLASIAADADHGACDTSITGAHPAFTMSDITVNQLLAGGATATVNGSLQMNDTGASQNACQGAALTLTFSSN
jgi:hypothetical protein